MSKTIEERVNNLENLLHTIITSINATRQFISTGFGKIDENFTIIDKKIDQLSTDVDAISGNANNRFGTVDDNFHQVKLHLESIQEEISKINTVTNYDEIVSNMKLVKGGK